MPTSRIVTGQLIVTAPGVQGQLGIPGLTAKPSKEAQASFVKFLLTSACIFENISYMETRFKQLVRQRKLTLTSLAKCLSVSRVHLTNIANGSSAGRQLAKRIEQWSNGDISHSELLYPDKD